MRGNSVLGFTYAVHVTVVSILSCLSSCFVPRKKASSDLPLLDQKILDVLQVLLGDNPGPLPDNLQPTEAGALSMFDVFAVQSQYWPCLQIPLFVQHLARMSSRGHRKGKR